MGIKKLYEDSMTIHESEPSRETLNGINTNILMEIKNKLTESASQFLYSFDNDETREEQRYIVDKLNEAYKDCPVHIEQNEGSTNDSHIMHLTVVYEYEKMSVEQLLRLMDLIEEDNTLDEYAKFEYNNKIMLELLKRQNSHCESEGGYVKNETDKSNE